MAIDYIYRKDRKPKTIYAHNLDSHSRNHFSQQLEVMNRHSVKNQYLHYKMSFHPSENVSNKLLQTLTKELIIDHDLEDNQVLSVSHGNTDHIHQHILCNRLSFGLNLTSDSHIGIRSKKLAQKLEKKYGLMTIEDLKKEYASEINVIIAQSEDEWDMAEQLKHEGYVPWLNDQEEVVFKIRDSKIKVSPSLLDNENENKLIRFINRIHENDTEQEHQIITNERQQRTF